MATHKGNYYTTIHLYVPFKTIGNDVIKRCYRTLSVLIAESQIADARLEILNPNHFHISLTRGVDLKYHFIDPFLQVVSATISKFQSFPVILDTNIVNIYANSAKNRFFAGIGVKNASAKSKIQQLLDSLDLALEQFGFEKYNITPHVSLVSTPCNISQSLDKRYPSHTKLLWPKIQLESNISAADELELDKIVADTLNELPEDELHEDTTQFENCIVDYDCDIASFNATSVVVTVGAKTNRIYFK